MKSFMDFQLEFLNHIDLEENLHLQWNVDQLKNDSRLSDKNMTFQYVSILSDIMTHNLFPIILIATFNILLILPANILTVIVIFRNKELWTPSNIVLSINGIIQAIASATYLISRGLWLQSLFLLPMHNQYKESMYLVGWWTVCIMMRTGNNRLVFKT